RARHSCACPAAFDAEPAWRSVPLRGNQRRWTELAEGAAAPATEVLAPECGVAASQRTRTKCSQAGRSQIERQVIWEGARRMTRQEGCTDGLAVAQKRQSARGLDSQEVRPDSARPRSVRPGPGRLSVVQTARRYRQAPAAVRRYTACLTS